MAVSVARPLSVSVYAPLSRLRAMNPRIATACSARDRDSDRGMVDTSRGAEQDHSVLCTELHRRPCHDLFPQPSPEQSLLAPFGLVLADPRARRGNRGSGLARTRKQSQAVIAGGVSRN